MLLSLDSLIWNLRSHGSLAEMNEHMQYTHTHTTLNLGFANERERACVAFVSGSCLSCLIQWPPSSSWKCHDFHISLHLNEIPPCKLESSSESLWIPIAWSVFLQQFPSFRSNITFDSYWFLCREKDIDLVLLFWVWKPSFPSTICLGGYLFCMFWHGYLTDLGGYHYAIFIAEML